MQLVTCYNSRTVLQDTRTVSIKVQYMYKKKRNRMRSIEW